MVDFGGFLIMRLFLVIFNHCAFAKCLISIRIVFMFQACQSFGQLVFGRFPSKIQNNVDFLGYFTQFSLNKGQSDACGTESQGGYKTRKSLKIDKMRKI